MLVCPFVVGCVRGCPAGGCVGELRRACSSKAPGAGTHRKRGPACKDSQWPHPKRTALLPNAAPPPLEPCALCACAPPLRRPLAPRPPPPGPSLPLPLELLV